MRGENTLSDNHFQAQFTALKDQISPHFLFNSLSVLSSLVRKDPDLSERFIDHLAKVYRYLLEHRDDDYLTLATELDFARSYAFLLEVRFVRKFRVDFPEAVSADDFTLLPFTLQLLIENAIRHNRMSASEPLIVTVAREENDYLRVSNNRQLRSQPDTLSAGTGTRSLAGVQHRYAMLTGRTVQVEETELAFSVRIPLQKSGR
ncbi:MAG: sensor histidine kinase [Larkinella arboricola]